MNFALVRFLNTHVHSVEREEKRPSRKKPTTKTLTQVLLVNPPTPKWSSQTQHVMPKWRRYSERWLLTTGVAAEEPQTHKPHAHTPHTHTSKDEQKYSASGPGESTCRSLRLCQCTFALLNQRFQTYFQLRDVDILQQVSSRTANIVTVMLRLIYALRALAASQFLHPPAEQMWVEKGIGTTLKGKKGFPVKMNGGRLHHQHVKAD